MKILYINQEIIPYVPESEMALAGKSVPQGIQEKGCEIRTFMPKWGTINERRGQLHEVQRLSRMMMIINETDHPLIIKVASIPGTRIQVYFIDNDDFFTGRKMACDENGVEYEDNGERAVFFARGVLETVKKLRWVPDVIHCQGWMTSIIPFLIKTAYADEPSFADTKIITSLFGGKLSIPMSSEFKSCVEYRDAKAELLDSYGDPFTYDDLIRLSIDYSDGIVKATDSVPAEYTEYAESKGVSLLDITAQDDPATACKDFYGTVSGKE